MGKPRDDKDAAQDLTYRYAIHAYEDARQKRPIKHEHGGPPSSPTATKCYDEPKS